MPTHSSSTPDTSDREIILSRVFDAPRTLVWRAFTEPEHVAKWWGPRGFTDTTKRHEFRVGGYWEHTMHGPDGTDYPNKAKFLEIVPPERITFLLCGGSDLEDEERRGATFRATWTFEVVDAERTRLTGRMVFPSKEARDRVVRDYGAIEGGKQTLQKHADYLPAMSPASPDFVLTRVFDAPRDLVWKAWTEEAHLKRWFGPKGFTMTKCAMDFRVGGVFHYGMKSPDGHEMWGKWTFVEIVAPEKLVLLSSFSDANGGVTRHPMSATWPLETLSATTFTEHGGKTTLTLRWAAHKATAEERKTFDSAHAGMTQGWGGTMAQLEAYLARLEH